MSLEKIANSSFDHFDCAKCGQPMIGNEKDKQGESICSDCFLFPNGRPKITPEMIASLKRIVLGE